MVDVILQAVERDGPRLKDCLPAVGALKHLREWHSAHITIAANDSNRYTIYFRPINKVTLVLHQWFKIKTASWVLHVCGLRIHTLVFYYCLRGGIAHANLLQIHALTRGAGKKPSPLKFLLLWEQKVKYFVVPSLVASVCIQCSEVELRQVITYIDCSFPIFIKLVHNSASFILDFILPSVLHFREKEECQICPFWKWSIIAQ